MLYPHNRLQGSILWGDDQTMGTVLVARMAPLLKKQAYADEVARQQVGFAKRLRDPADGLNFHGFNAADVRGTALGRLAARGGVASLVSAAMDLPRTPRANSIASPEGLAPTPYRTPLHLPITNVSQRSDRAHPPLPASSHFLGRLYAGA